MSLDSIVNSFVKDTPPGEISSVASNIKAIIEDDSKNLSSAFDELISAEPQLIKLGSGYTIVSSFNRAGSKYQDILAKKKFNVDLEKSLAIDVEDFDADTDSDLSAIEKKLSKYVQDHFPSNYYFTLVPNGSNEIVIIIVDVKLSSKNYYNGKWVSVYHYNKLESTLKGEVRIDVHYYEEGNVRLKTSETIEEIPVTIDAVVNKISQIEDEFEKKLLVNVSKLNEEYFKNLRRQLPINRSKVQWGKSIANYKLGQDAAGGKH